MSLRATHPVAFFLVLAFLMPLVPDTLRADDVAPTKPENSQSSQMTRRKPLPSFYGQIGVTDDQRAQLYSVQDTYEVKLEKLRQELKALTSERDAKLEAILTSGQKTRLKELREASRRKAAERAAAAGKK